MAKQYELAVIGAGPGGMEAALEASRLGVKTVLIEKKQIGGTCLNTGCIPTKTLLKSSRLAAQISNSSTYGIETVAHELSWPKLMQRKQAVMDQLRKAAELTLVKNKVEVLYGEAVLQDSRHIVIKNKTENITIEAKNILIASGSEPMPIPGILIDGKNVLTSSEILNLPQKPKSILIVGAGAIGIEFASFFLDLGVDVSLLEMQERILPSEDADCANRLETLFTRKGIRIFTGTKVLSIEVGSAGAMALLSNQEKLHAELVLIAIGRKRLSQGLGLEKTQVKILPNGAVEVNDYFETTNSGIYAIGDVIRSPQLAHVAAYEGICAVRNMLGRKEKADYTAIASCVYSYPEVMHVGFVPQTENDKAQCLEVKVPFTSIGKSVAEGETDGFLKLSAYSDGRLAGAAAIGAHVTELIPELALAIRLKLHVKDLAETVHAHPTEAEIIQIAARELTRRLKS